MGDTVRTHLYEAVQRRQRAAESLARIGRLISQSLDSKKVQQSIVDSVRTLLDVDAARLYRLDPESGDLITLAISGDEHYVGGPGTVFPSGTGVSSCAVRERRPILTTEPLTDPRFTLPPEVRAHLEQSPPRAVLAVPLFLEGRVIGAITIRAGRVFDDEDIQLVQAFADQAAIALHNARLYEQVRAGRERLQALSRQLVEVQEAERRHIARELHDEIGQGLTGLKFLLEMEPDIMSEASRAQLAEARMLVGSLLEQVRQLSLDLRPAMLDDLGLLPALLWYFERYTARTNVHVTFRHSGVERRFNPSVETTVYRLIQETLTNVARHAGVREATVQVWVEKEYLTMQIEDRGKGFEPEAVLTRGTSSGLAGMYERAVLLGGRLTVESAPAAGTTVMAQFPLRGTLERRKRPR